jgi:hypothetical protein
MYQSNQERIKKKKPSLLPGHRRTPRGWRSLALAREQSRCATDPVNLTPTPSGVQLFPQSQAGSSCIQRDTNVHIIVLKVIKKI